MSTDSTMFVKVTRRVQETPDIISIELCAEHGGALPAFEAGAHIDVHVSAGVVRQYSLCNPPSEQHRYVIGVLRDPASRGGSIAIHEGFTEGSRVEIGVPRNHFPLLPSGGSILIAGGIGVTPILCMAEALHSQGRNFVMHYCARSKQQAGFLDRIKHSSFASRVAVHFDDEASLQKLDIDEMISQARDDDEFYVCGPSGFIDWVCASAEKAGIAKHRIRFEYFNAKPVDTSHDQPFQVQVASTGQVFDIPADRSITSVLCGAGVDIYTSCEEGTCGTCVTRIIKGVPDHRDVFLTDDEHSAGDVFTPCCSRSKSEMLVLDL
ncbi:oxidoreductase [Pseudomonas sp. MWU12-2312b]|uniref:PDR/VanB family oxidoreductase n=1 Tax=Pseudomonas moorei TaxID=395599 RepID=UPI000D4620B8|nr:PDR/VanB family oxidoreductase [Pseudomonas moorei]PPA04500.1 oxidoreductase [Pseudomonas sp. MWU12-2312b]